VKVPGAVKLMYKNVVSEPRPVMQSAHVNDSNAASHVAVTAHPSLKTGIGTASDTLQMSTGNHELADSSGGTEAGAAPSSDADTVQQNQRQVHRPAFTTFVYVCLCDKMFGSDGDAHRNCVFPCCKLIA